MDTDEHGSGKAVWNSVSFRVHPWFDSEMRKRHWITATIIVLWITIVFVRNANNPSPKQLFHRYISGTMPGSVKSFASREERKDGEWKISLSFTISSNDFHRIVQEESFTKPTARYQEFLHFPEWFGPYPTQTVCYARVTTNSFLFLKPRRHLEYLCVDESGSKGYYYHYAAKGQY